MNDHPAHLEPLFGRHETFAPRYGWFKKAQDALVSTLQLFSSRRSRRFGWGVGKNMVRSIRLWCLAAGVIEEDRSARRGPVDEDHRPSANLLYGTERVRSVPRSTRRRLWVIHWHLATNLNRSTTWYWTFSHFHEPEFSRERSPPRCLSGRMTLLYGKKVPAEVSVKRDVDTFLAPTRRRDKRSGETLAEDTIDCPLRTLGLVEAEVDRSGVYRFRVGPKPMLRRTCS